MPRQPLALCNWKMAMTVAESLAFVREFQVLAGDLLDAVEVVICPPFTALWAVAQELRESRLGLGGQDIAPTTNLARTGGISATLLADAGCRWVLLGHWEIRRHRGDDDALVNRKVHLALDAGLTPVLLVGEARADPAPPEVALERQLARVLEGCQAEQVATMALVYEPEAAIGVAAPASPDHVTAGCAFIRRWLGRRWGEAVAERVRIIYGGSVAPAHAAALLAAPDLDGLGATRHGRDPESFVEIVRQIARAK
jgi:triosephosphate isomerase